MVASRHRKEAKGTHAMRGHGHSTGEQHPPNDLHAPLTYIVFRRMVSSSKQELCTTCFVSHCKSCDALSSHHFNPLILGADCSRGCEADSCEPSRWHDVCKRSCLRSVGLAPFICPSLIC